jgi:hypothetical protein
MTMITSGCPFKDIPQGLYKMWEIPLIVRTRPVPAWHAIPGNDSLISYDGDWHSGDGKLAALNPRTRYTDDTGSSAEFGFHGTGVAVVSEKGAEFGSADVFLDGQRKASLNFQTENFPRISSVEVFAATNLPAGSHRLRIVNTGMGTVALESLRVIE